MCRGNIRGIIYGARKNIAFAGKNACPGKLLLCMWGATFVARRRHQSASNEDVQKLPHCIISPSQDGFLWFWSWSLGAPTRVCGADSSERPRRPPGDGPRPSPTRKPPGGRTLPTSAVHRGSDAAEKRALIFYSQEKQIDFECGGIRFLDFLGAWNLQERKLEIRNADFSTRGWRFKNNLAHTPG